MSIFSDNITSDLLVKSVYDITINVDGWYNNTMLDEILRHMVFKYSYKNSNKDMKEVIKDIFGNMSLTWISNIKLDNIQSSYPRALRKYLKHYIKRESMSTFYIEQSEEHHLTLGFHVIAPCVSVFKIPVEICLCKRI